MGIDQSLFGEGGMGSMLMSLLGLGAAAHGMGMFGESGPLSGIGEHLGALFGWPGRQGSTPPNLSGSPPPIAPQPVGEPSPAPAPLDLAGIMADQKIDPAERSRIMGSPQLRQHMMNAPTTERDRYIRHMLAGDPQMGDQLGKARMVLGAPAWLGGGRENVLASAKKQYGLEPGEFDSLMDSYGRIGP